MTQQWKIGGLILAFIVIAGPGIAVQRIGQPATPVVPAFSIPSTTPVTSGTPATPSKPSGQGGQSSASLASSTAPSLNRKVSITADLPLDAKQILTKKITDLQALIAKDYNDYAAWMNLAISYKMAGDYEGAKQIWIYENTVHPGESISLHNLGSLYQNEYKNYPVAEDYYLQAMNADVTKSVNYLALFDLYRYNYKQDTTAAVDILKTGISRVSGTSVIDLYAALALYYEGKGDAASAITYYTEARDAAKTAGNTALAAQFDASIEALK